jgi:hypothetical protein
MELLQLEGILATEIQIVVPFVQVCRLRERWTWDVHERMEKESVDEKCGGIQEIEAHTVGREGDERIKHREMAGLLPPPRCSC